MVQFKLAGQSYQALNGGPHDTFNDAISMSVTCEDQNEVDRLWSALTADGGKPVQCGWLKDKYGLPGRSCRSVCPRCSPIPPRARRVMEALLKMVKIDIAALEAGRGALIAPASAREHLGEE
jgi:predicted 3-demethylubiquinone-9 3-methyltransferase (glyoxalase superfamily)